MIGISFGSLFPIKASFYEHEQSMSTIKVDVLHTLTASLDSYFQFWQLKCILMAKPKLKNVKKAGPNYFSILHENISCTDTSFHNIGGHVEVESKEKISLQFFLT